jgi:hypothetical protein
MNDYMQGIKPCQNRAEQLNCAEKGTRAVHRIQMSWYGRHILM